MCAFSDPYLGHPFRRKQPGGNAEEGLTKPFVAGEGGGNGGAATRRRSSVRRGSADSCGEGGNHRRASHHLNRLASRALRVSHLQVCARRATPSCSLGTVARNAPQECQRLLYRHACTSMFDSGVGWASRATTKLENAGRAHTLVSNARNVSRSLLYRTHQKFVSSPMSSHLRHKRWHGYEFIV